ncbi:hypothetical protein [Planktotalea sp.]|uniref:hypothetical protein n=1 Tax=Planktotalea sp. TaxID=2029877 RepID=UPI003296C4B6
MSLVRSGIEVEQAVAALTWSPMPDMGAQHPAGQVVEEAVDGLCFVLSRTRAEGEGVLSSHGIEMPAGPSMLRVDEVCFPVGAIAHRHSHTGTGIRHLVRGSLRIEAEEHSKTMSVGDNWFEAAATPVRAVALQTTGVSSFLRAMVIPASFAGKSTFTLVDPADADLPRLQLTHRHIDLPLHSEAG